MVEPVLITAPNKTKPIQQISKGKQSLLSGLDSQWNQWERSVHKCKKAQRQSTGTSWSYLKGPDWPHQASRTTQASLIVVHVGTNDITNNVDTEEMLQALVNDVHKESPDMEIAISRVVTRKDRPAMDKEVVNLNSRLKNLCARNHL